MVGLAALIGGYLWEGGSLSGLLQLNAALIVFGGTIAAVMISFPAAKLRSIPTALRMAFGRNPERDEEGRRAHRNVHSEPPRRRFNARKTSGGTS